MTTDRMVVWLRKTMDAAQRDAEAATPGPWAPEGPLLADVVTSALLGRVADCSVGTGYRPQSLPDARHIARNGPDAVLRRIARDRETLDDCENAIIGWTHAETKELAQDVIRNLAEGWGWKEDQ